MSPPPALPPIDLSPDQPLPEDVPTLQALVRALLATGKPVVVAGVRNPYDIAALGDAPTYLATYGYTAASLESLTRVLFGEIGPVGRLPVAIPRADGSGVLYPLGHGLRY